VYRQRLGWEGAYRIVPDSVPGLEQVGLPPVVRRLAEHRHGLLLVTGPARSGKTTSLAALIQHINTHRADHIITVEDPIECVITPCRCRVTQREVGAHTRGFTAALEAAVHQDPDVIMVGDLRDHDTTSIAVGAAESGHLVLGSLHTHTATRTVARILEMYPPQQRDEIATMLASSMRGVTSQMLLPRADARGLVLAVEVLLLTPAVAQAIREHKASQVYNLMQSSKRIGMRTMDDALMELAEQGVISGPVAYDRAEHKRPFEPLLRRASL
jgi:twitching motility protein PilT